MILAVTSGTTYRIAIDGYNAQTGTTNLGGSFTVAAPPAPTPPPTPTPTPPADTTAPETTITDAPGSATTNTRPLFSFISSEDGSTFACQMEGRAWFDCGSPFQPAAALSNGFHSFAVRATDIAGNTDRTPASVAFTVQAPATTPAPDPGPPILNDGFFTPTSTTLSVVGRTATLSLTCVPASASSRSRVAVIATDGHAAQAQRQRPRPSAGLGGPPLTAASVHSAPLRP